MNDKIEIPRDDVSRLYDKLWKDAESAGYHLNPDEEVTRGLVKGLLVNEKRYGYYAYPCRLASGEKKKDLDIICPCDYRDPDLAAAMLSDINYREGNLGHTTRRSFAQIQPPLPRIL